MAPFRRDNSRGPSRSRSPTPTPSTDGRNTSARTPDTTLLSNVPPGSSGETDRATVDSRTFAAIAVPLKNEAFQKAIQECLDNLSDDDKEAFRSATDVIEKLGELQQGKSRISSSHTTGTQKVQKVLQCVKQFLVSVAICIQHHSEVSSLVVGGLLYIDGKLSLVSQYVV